MIEVELKEGITRGKFESLMTELRDIFVRTVRETDTYFYPPRRDYAMTPGGREFLRLREHGSEAMLEHKNVVYSNGRKTHAVETAVPVAEPEAFKKMLGIMGFRVHVVIDKTRHMFEDDRFVIVLD